MIHLSKFRNLKYILLNFTLYVRQKDGFTGIFSTHKLVIGL